MRQVWQIVFRCCVQLVDHSLCPPPAASQRLRHQSTSSSVSSLGSITRPAVHVLNKDSSLLRANRPRWARRDSRYSPTTFDLCVLPPPSWCPSCVGGVSVYTSLTAGHLFCTNSHMAKLLELFQAFFLCFFSRIVLTSEKKAPFLLYSALPYSKHSKLIARSVQHLSIQSALQGIPMTLPPFQSWHQKTGGNESREPPGFGADWNRQSGRWPGWILALWCHLPIGSCAFEWT